ncbi:acyl-CoA dehydrogenase family protein [Vineibacter terrae]|uniref:acyl-CoA dehydrogenase family protein n=1 Tax=Vineibacter terrae TaxID=2586908 RepID=UPI002E3525A5|nr:acyl-CoA dehydrogenase family protein [Vineibacter terrae]HEX2891744.1 acyl-CoA dehydrogenase family protein [Vineibacter terrae]
MAEHVSPWMTEELSILRDQARRFLEREFVPHRERWDKAGIVDRDAWRKAGAAGLLCASIPEAYGGGGGTRAHDLVIAEEIGRAGLGGGFGAGSGVHSNIVAHYLLAYGTEAQKLRWLPGMASGDLVGAVAMTEPNTGSDLKSVRTAARRDGDVYVLNGQKTFITNGQNADLIVVVAKTDPAAGARGVSLLVVETASAAGFRRGRNLEKIGMHAQDTSELFFDDVRVPAENLLGETEGQGFVQLMVQLAWERLSCAHGAVVAMERAVELTAAYVKERKAFGAPLISFQNTQFKLAEAKTQAVVARTFVDDLTVKLLAGTLDPTTAAMAKWWTTDTQCRVIDECLQLFGGYGYMTEYPIARMYADARVQKIYAGTNEIMKMLIARAL